MLRYDCHVHGGDSIRSTCITNFEQMDQDCQGHQKGRGREEGGKARRKKERKNNGHWFRPARPDVRRATSQAKRFKSKGSSPRTSTVDSNRYGGVKVRVTLTVLVRNTRMYSTGIAFVCLLP